MKRPKVCIWLPIPAIESLKVKGRISQELALLVDEFYWDGLFYKPDRRIFMPVSKKQVTFYPDAKSIARLRKYCKHNGKSITLTITQALIVLNLYQLPD